jgi:hypothetical protein
MEKTDKWIWIIPVIFIIAYLVISNNFKFSFKQNPQPSNIIVECKNYDDCISKLRNMGYSDEEIYKFGITCSETGCVVVK